MQRVFVRVLGLVALALGTWCVLPTHRLPVEATAAAAVVKFEPRNLKFTGNASCSIGPCHNARGPLGSAGSEYGTFMAKDPHKDALPNLTNARSKLIEKNLKKLADVKQAHPEKNPLCLKCHSLVPPVAQRGEKFDITDGVSCEACHGPAQEWLNPHKLPEWKNLTDPQKAAKGMRPTKNLLYRAQACAECHVGTADREVNHDLIAAGHPRLSMELYQLHTTYTGYYKAKHWGERGINREADFYARMWACGQVVSLDLALELLEARAAAIVKGGNPKAAVGEQPVWPEFSEYDCFACHHGLRDEEWRRQRDFKQLGRLPGSYPWGTWYLAMTDSLVKHWPVKGASSPMEPLQQLASLMSKPYPEPAEVVKSVQAARTQLAPWGERLTAARLTAPALGSLQATFAREEEKDTRQGWDACAQLYLSLDALQQGRRTSAPQAADVQRVGQQLDKLSGPLGFPKGYDSPVGFDVKKFQTELGKLRQLLPR